MLALTGAAIAVPVLDQFGRAPDVFVAIDAGRVDLWLFAIVVAFVPPLSLIAAEITVGFVSDRARAGLHVGFVGLLVAAIVIPLVRERFDLRGVALGALAIAASSLLVFAWSRARALRLWLTYASPLPVVAVALFVFGSAASEVGAIDAPPAIAELPRAPGAARALDRPVVLVVLDEFPLSVMLDGDGGIDRERFPGFARLAADSVWYRNAITVASHTEQAVPAILTGRVPDDGARAPTWSEYPDNLFRMLAGSFAMHVDETVTQLCADEHCPDPPRTPITATNTSTRATRGSAPSSKSPAEMERARAPGLGDVLGQARREFVRRVSLDPEDRLAEATVGEDITTATARPAPTSTAAPSATLAPATIPATTASPTTSAPSGPFGNFAAIERAQPGRFVEFLSQFSPSEPARSFHYLHLLLPHVPWHLTADGIPYDYSSDARMQFPGYDGTWVSDAAADAARLRVAMQAGYVDSLVGLLIDRLESTGLWDDAIVVITSDHGLGLGEGAGTRRYGVATDELLGVPLFLHAPGLDASIDDRDARTIDIVPTIIDLLGARSPWPLDGTSLVGRPIPRTTTPFVQGTIGGPATRTTIDTAGHLAWVRAAGMAGDTSTTTAGTGPDARRDLRFVRLGPRGELIGRPIAEVGDARSVAFAFEFPDDDAFASVDPDNELPLHVVGRIADDQVHAGELVVVVVEGVVAASAEVFTDRDGAPRFTGVLNPAALHEGSNQIRLFVVA